MTKASFSIIGNLTRDPEMKVTASGMSIATLGIACNRRVKQGEEWGQETSFFNVTLFGKQAETCGKYLHKGDRVGVDGYMKQESWEKDGQKRTAIKFNGNELFFLTSKKESHGAGPTDSNPYTGSEDYDNGPNDDAVPF